jgi:hypothetical protein
MACGVPVGDPGVDGYSQRGTSVSSTTMHHQPFNTIKQSCGDTTSHVPWGGDSFRPVWT